MTLTKPSTNISATGWMPNSPRYQLRLANEMQKMQIWASNEQLAAFRQGTRQMTWGHQWALALRSNYHKTIVTDGDDPRYKIPGDELNVLVKVPFGMVLPDEGVTCNHYVQEEIQHDTNNPSRRLMKCAACGDVFWVTREGNEE